MLNYKLNQSYSRVDQRVSEIIKALVLCFFITTLALSSVATAISNTPITMTQGPLSNEYKSMFDREEVWCFLKVEHEGNIYSFNFPESVYVRFSQEEVDDIVASFLSIFDRSFGVFEDFFSYRPSGYQFNVFFGTTEKGLSKSIVYPVSKNADIIVNVMPYRKQGLVVSSIDKKVFLHGLGHTFFGIAIGKMESPRTKAFEQGFADYVAGHVLSKDPERGRVAIMKITATQAKRLSGLTQLDIDASIWGAQSVITPAENSGYAGVTYDVFGGEFIRSYIHVFGKDTLSEFFVRVKAMEDVAPGDDHGTSQVQDILREMSFPDDKIVEFERELHKNLISNIFKVAK